MTFAEQSANNFFQLLMECKILKHYKNIIFLEKEFEFFVFHYRNKIFTCIHKILADTTSWDQNFTKGARTRQQFVVYLQRGNWCSTAIMSGDQHDFAQYFVANSRGWLQFVSNKTINEETRLLLDEVIVESENSNKKSTNSTEHHIQIDSFLFVVKIKNVITYYVSVK